MLLKYTEELVETSKMTIVCVDTSGLDESELVIVYFIYSRNHLCLATIY